jgi:hypothetical protein
MQLHHTSRGRRAAAFMIKLMIPHVQGIEDLHEP